MKFAVRIGQGDELPAARSARRSSARSSAASAPRRSCADRPARRRASSRPGRQRGADPLGDGAIDERDRHIRRRNYRQRAPRRRSVQPPMPACVNAPTARAPATTARDHRDHADIAHDADCGVERGTATSRSGRAQPSSFSKRVAALGDQVVARIAVRGSSPSSGASARALGRGDRALCDLDLVAAASRAQVPRSRAGIDRASENPSPRNRCRRAGSHRPG